MANYKVVFDGEEQDEVFATYDEAEQHALYLLSCFHTGGEILEMSNPGDYPYDPTIEPEYEIIETDEAVEELDDRVIMFQKIVSGPGVYDDEGEYIRCQNCGHGLHYYNGVPTCPECESYK